MKNKTVKIRLLNDGEFDCKGVKFPVEVDGFDKCGITGLVKVIGSEMIRVGWNNVGIDKSWGYTFTKDEYELVSETPTYNKKLIDAVNALHGDLKNDPTWVGDETHYGVGFYGGKIRTLRITINSSLKGVHGTVEEFNRCVAEMSWHGGSAEFSIYSNSEKQPLTKENSDYSFYGVKHAVKVEYVKVKDSIFHLQPDLEARELYFLIGESAYILVANEAYLIASMGEDNLYRKVETEISPEQSQIDSVVQDIHASMPEINDATAKDLAYMLQERGHLKQL